ncbi:MAG: hypothetical protein ABQ298_08560 [Puniceicoccaceae bacterium]
MKEGPVCRLGMLVALVLLGTGCAQREPDPLVGVWRSGETELRFYLDGSYQLENESLSNSGFYQISAPGNLVVFTYEYRKAIRNMSSRFDLNPDGRLLSLDRTPAGTLVLTRAIHRQLPTSQVSSISEPSGGSPRWPEVSAGFATPQRAAHRRPAQFEFPTTDASATTPY